VETTREMRGIKTMLCGWYIVACLTKYIVVCPRKTQNTGQAHSRRSRKREIGFILHGLTVKLRLSHFGSAAPGQHFWRPLSHPWAHHLSPARHATECQICYWIASSHLKHNSATLSLMAHVTNSNNRVRNQHPNLLTPQSIVFASPQKFMRKKYLF
jgi:hypothetical protein